VSVERLAQAIAGPDSDDRTWATGEITQVYADGLVDVDLGRGPVTCQVLGSYTPRTGDVVAVLRQTLRDGAKPLVLGATRTENATTVDVQSQLAVVWNVAAAPAPGGGTSGSTAFNPTAVKSWRAGTGWSRDEAYQGVYTSQFGVWRGCYFYGSAIRSTLRGVTVTSATIRLSRADAGGIVAGVPVRLARHTHESQPGGGPIEVPGRTVVGSVARGAVATVSLPTSWAQTLVDGTGGTRGLMHADDSFANYAIFRALAADAQSGRLTINWTS
jgi:hypothetical protein